MAGEQVRERELFGDDLPTYLTRFVGRSAEIAAVEHLMETGRLITICGVGGSGKTRLAIELARRLAGETRPPTFADGSCWVGLAGVGDPDSLAHAIASALGLREAVGARPREALMRSLADQRLLLILDNCEQLAKACAGLLDELLSRCPHVVVVTTSRQALGAEGEVVYPIPPLGRTGTDPDTDEGIAMFIDRASMNSPAYVFSEWNAATIGDICELLDGLPLAIELAASWVRVLSVRDLLAELKASAGNLTSAGAPVEHRHSSMSAVLSSSWEWLSEDERRVLTALGVFTGGFTRAAAEHVAGASLSLLASLTERALIQRMPDASGGTRYHIHELVRSFAANRLKRRPALADQTRARHFDHFLEIVERADAAWDTAEEEKWVAVLLGEEGNLNAAMTWAIAQAQTERALRMAAGLFSCWLYASPSERSATLLAQTLALPWQDSSTAAIKARARVLNVAGYSAAITLRFDIARQRFTEALALYELLDDTSSAAWSLRGLGYVRQMSARLPQPPSEAERSLAMCRAIGDERGIAWSMHDLGEAALVAGDLHRAESWFTQSLSMFETLGVFFGAYRAHCMLGVVHRARGQWTAALTEFSCSLSQERRTRYANRGPDIAEGVAGVAAGLHRPEIAATLFGASDAWRESFGSRRLPAFESLHNGDLQRAHRQLSHDAFDTAYQRGHEMTIAVAEQTIAGAIAELDLVASALPAGLTPREVDVLRLVAAG